MTAPLICCPAASLQAVCRERRPSHVLTLASPGKPEPLPIAEAEWLHLVFNDIPEPRPGLLHPTEADVTRILAFGRAWAGARPLFVSCEMGISRSTAALFILACDRWPAEPEEAVAARLRAAAPCATPNPLLVSLADGLLGRRGRMVRAIAGIGRGAEYAPYRSFEIPPG